MRFRASVFSLSSTTIAFGFLAMFSLSAFSASLNAELSDRPVARTISPTAPYKTLDAFEQSIGERGVLYRDEHVWMMAAAAKAREAELVFLYLVEGYNAMFDIVGADTNHVMLVYAFPMGHPDFFGGTYDCVIYYDESNLNFGDHEEWVKHGVPHMYGFFQSMAGNFVEATGARFGRSALAWHVAAVATRKAADNQFLADRISRDRQLLLNTFHEYQTLGNVVPEKLKRDLAYRIYAHLLWECELEYGSNFWFDAFEQIRFSREDLLSSEWSEFDNATQRNGRHAITVDSLDRLPDLDFRGRLEEAGIALDIDLYSLVVDTPDWNRRLK